MLLCDSYVEYQLSRHLCDESHQPRIMMARDHAYFLSLLCQFSAPRCTLGTKPGSGATQSATRRANERIPCRKSVRRARYLRSILLEACPCILRSQTRAAQQQRAWRAPQQARDLLRRIGAAAWRPIRRSREELHHVAGTRTDCPEYGESAETQYMAKSTKSPMSTPMTQV